MNSLYFYVVDTEYWQCRNCRARARLQAIGFFHDSKLAILKGYQTIFLITRPNIIYGSLAALTSRPYVMLFRSVLNDGTRTEVVPGWA